MHRNAHASSQTRTHAHSDQASWYPPSPATAQSDVKLIAMLASSHVNSPHEVADLTSNPPSVRVLCWDNVVLLVFDNQ